MAIRPSLVALLLLVLQALFAAALGQATAADGGSQGCWLQDPNVGSLSVTGSASVDVVPDWAKISFAVEVTRPDARDAREVAAQTTAAVVAAVDGVNGIDASKDVSTENLSINPKYSDTSSDGEQIIIGYTFSQVLTVQVHNVGNGTAVADVIDAAVEAGGNDLQVQSITIDLSTEAKYAATQQARTMAVEDGMSTAALLAQAAHVRLGAIKSISDNNVAPQTSQSYADTSARGAAAMAAPISAPTPISVGTMQLTASVGMVFAITNSAK